MSLVNEYMLSCYDELYVIREVNKNKIIVVKNKINNRIYVKKVIRNHNKDIYFLIKDNQHINIARVYEVIEDDNMLIIIEELINGNTLEELLEEVSVFSEETVKKYIAEICDALDHIHSLNCPIIHRDIKPSNIMITNDGIVKLIDFDASRTFKEDNKSNDTVLLGTSGFAPPEQYGFAQTDCRSDIYAVGILMNYMLTGKHPNDEIYRGELKGIIKKCINLIQDKRYSSVKDLKKDICLLDKPLKLGNESKHLWTIPGFRSKSLWKILVGIIGYLLIFIISFSANSEGVQTSLIEKIIVLITLLSILALYTNYLNINAYLPMVRSANIFIKITGYTLMSILLILFFALINIVLLKIL